MMDLQRYFSDKTGVESGRARLAGTRFRAQGVGSRGWGSVTEMCSGSEAGSYLRLIDFVYHSTLGLRVIKKKKFRDRVAGMGPTWVPRT